jgi:alkanesulfonate monooxygenase SsuD/methylene tetrahydromethanopterin reductase-like flavin-dependent oxidoreductase (luciferase family)
MDTPKLKLGFIAAPVDAPGSSDEELYAAMVADVEFHRALGFDVAWMIEHHFSDYYPTPDPLMYLSHLTALYPEMEVGTAVLVTPWHEPLRLAEQISMLSHMTGKPLHLGIGRGTAKYEYDAFGLDMGQARERFKETYEILRLALAGEPFDYAGERLNVRTKVQLRPRPRLDQINFYGAIGSPSSASIMAELGLPPICTSIGDFGKQRETIETWRATATERGLNTDVQLPIMVNCIVADSDEEALAEAQTHISRFMQAQVDHYAGDKTDWASIKGYEQWAATFARLKELTDPANIPGWAAYQLVGSPETVRGRMQELMDIGFNHVILQCATPGVPLRTRQVWSRRFVEEVVPALSVPDGHSVPDAAGTLTVAS